MDLEPCFKVDNLVVIQLNNTKLGRMTNLANLNMIFYMVVLIYRLDQICNSPQSPAQPQSGLLALVFLICKSKVILRRKFNTAATSHRDQTENQNWNHMDDGCIFDPRFGL